MTAAIAAQPRKNQENERFANDGSFESIEAQLHRLALRFYSRAAAMGVGMDLDDVRQELAMSYVRARAAWKPEKGVRFTTYFQTACMNNFNALMEKRGKEITHLGLISTETLRQSNMETEDGDVMEFITQDEGEEESHESRMIRAEEIRERLAALTPNSKRLISALLVAERSQDDAIVKLRDLADQLGIKGAELTRVRKEIKVNFGVSWV